MEEFIVRYGLVAIFVGAIVEGDLTLILTGVVAHMGLVRPPLAIAAGACGALVADGAFYLVGRYGTAAIARSKIYARAAPVIDHLIARLGPWEIVVARFVYGTRVASMLFWGMRRLPWRRFVILDALACGLWASALAALGFFLSGGAAVIIGEVKKAELWLLGALVAGVIIVVVLHTWGRRLRV